jgi:hypothetical protein
MACRTSWRIGRVTTFRLVLALCSLAAAGCAAERTAPTEAPATPAIAAAPEAEQIPARSPLSADVSVAEAPDTTPAPATSSPPAATAAETAVTAPTEKPSVVTVALNSPPADTLDFTALGARLRMTKAIGVLTKLAVKNQADDLLEQFRNYYKRQSTATLPDLHRSYDMLVLKLLSLLQDGDPPLATDISRSRAAIWDILSDQKKFVASHLMAGASP